MRTFLLWTAVADGADCERPRHCVGCIVRVGGLGVGETVDGEEEEEGARVVVGSV